MLVRCHIKSVYMWQRIRAQGSVSSFMFIHRPTFACHVYQKIIQKKLLLDFNLYCCTLTYLNIYIASSFILDNVNADGVYIMCFSMTRFLSC